MKGHKFQSITAGTVSYFHLSRIGCQKRAVPVNVLFLFDNDVRLQDVEDDAHQHLRLVILIIIALQSHRIYPPATRR